MQNLQLSNKVERWPIEGGFRIAREAKSETVVVVVTIGDGSVTGRGECVPYARFGETVDDVLAALDSLRPALRSGLTRQDLQFSMPPGAARNALDCALWDYEAKSSGRRAWHLAEMDAPAPALTAMTISLDEPDQMAQRALELSVDFPLLKLKLGGREDIERLQAVRAAVPEARLVVDANEGWTEDLMAEMLSICVECGVEMIEQPLPARSDAALQALDSPVLLCADEAFHSMADLDRIAGLYGAVNIKLDKTGGLTEALRVAEEARARDLKIMVGCMVGTSLSVAPALLLEGYADYCDLDGPLLLGRDREHGLRIDGCRILPPTVALWG